MLESSWRVSRRRTPGCLCCRTLKRLVQMRTRKGVEGVFSRRQMNDTSGRGTGIASSFAALHRAVRSPEEQPRLPFRSGSRDLFPLGRDPHHALPPKGYAQRVETLRRHLVDDALSALNWLFGKREPAPYARIQMQDACVARVETLRVFDAWRCCPQSVCQLLQRPCPRSCGVSTPLTVVRDLQH